eukprot:GGOE01016316.1.p1 GENE.GGOE01016316.1~~GGOE01016316.1.p1  ORF type:complete len:383 (-),score=146.75 GGOE01016316.1:359-1450(-)
MTSASQQWRQQFVKEISQPVIDLRGLRKLAFKGIPDECRRDYWYVLLGYLPPDRSQWDATLQQKRGLYRAYASEFIVDPKAQANEEDHPLSDKNGSAWGHHLKHQKLLEAIDLDLPRTLPSFNFFHNCNPLDPVSGSSLPTPEVDLGHGVVQFSAQATALRNVLYIYGVLNAAVGYVQGMNEILAPLYYVVYTSSKSPRTEAQDIEADAFFLFSIVMGHLRDNFMRSLDVDGPGIQSCIHNMVEVLQVCDYELYTSMQQKVPHHLYAFRWVTLLFCQEFVLPDVLLLWDGLFADRFKFTFLFYLCVSVLLLKREFLLAATAADILEQLQDLRHSVPVADLLRLGLVLYKRHGRSLVHSLTGSE